MRRSRFSAFVCRTIDKAKVEIDTWVNHDELKSVLNAGFQKGAKVSRMDKDSQSGLKAQEFPVYGPKALAGIGLNKLSRATRDRGVGDIWIPPELATKRCKTSSNVVFPLWGSGEYANRYPT